MGGLVVQRSSLTGQMVVHGTEESLQQVTWQNGGSRARLAWPAPQGARMPYVFVRENYFKWWVTVEGLTHLDVRHLAEKIGEQPEQQSEREKTAEFSIPTWMVLNGLEHLGYKVVTSGQYVTGGGRYDQREFVWTLHKSKEDWESSS